MLLILELNMIFIILLVGLAPWIYQFLTVFPVIIIITVNATYKGIGRWWVGGLTLPV